MIGLALLAPAGAADGEWVGSWATAAQSGAPSAPAPRTLRQILRTSLGGTVARIRISNTFGTRPLVVADARIARPAGGRPDAVAAGARRITFAGRDAVTVPAGETVASDPVVFPVPALGDVAVDLYLPEEAGPATLAIGAPREHFAAAGNVAGDAVLPAPQAVRDTLYLTGLDVQEPCTQGAIAALGASITAGAASSPDTHRRWTDLLARAMARARLRIGVLNLGISGNRLLRDGNGPSASARFERDVLAQPGLRWVILSDNPINDLGFAATSPGREPAPSADSLIGGLGALVARAHRRGIAVACSTLTPYRGADYWTRAGETERGRYNALLRASGHDCDAVIDQDAATRDPDDPTRLRPDYDSGDHLHPNDAGHAAIASAIDPARFGLASGCVTAALDAPVAADPAHRD